MIIDLPITDRPWQIGTPPPRDRFFEVATQGTTLICAYEERQEHWVIGTGEPLHRDDIHRWRDLSPEQLADLLNRLSTPIK